MPKLDNQLSEIPEMSNPNWFLEFFILFWFQFPKMCDVHIDV